MIRQLGLPTWFTSLSAADTRWIDLLRVLAELNWKKTLSDEEIESLTWAEKNKLVQQDPVTCTRFFDHRVHEFINKVLLSSHHPIGKIKDYFYRVEFQQRGSPHIHMLMWVEDAPVYKESSSFDVAEFIDKCVSCSSDVEDEIRNLVDMQRHKHSKSCRKKGKAICRFGFPIPPMKSTAILEPLSDLDDGTVETYKKKYKEISEVMNDQTRMNEMSHEDFLGSIKLTESEYIDILRSTLDCPKVFLQRKPSEVRINAYMKELISAWKANHDLQFVLDPYACAVYIVSYISKSQRGMSMLLDQACKEARKGNMDLRKQVRHIGNKFLNSVEISAQEAAYLVLQLPMAKCSRSVDFINTSTPDERTFLLKDKETLDKLKDTSTDIEASNSIKRYTIRPKLLSNVCLADFVSQWNVVYSPRHY